MKIEINHEAKTLTETLNLDQDDFGSMVKESMAVLAMSDKNSTLLEFLLKNSDNEKWFKFILFQAACQVRDDLLKRFK